MSKNQIQIQLEIQYVSLPPEKIYEWRRGLELFLKLIRELDAEERGGGKMPEDGSPPVGKRGVNSPE